MQQPDQSLPQIALDPTPPTVATLRSLVVGRGVIAVTSEDFLTGYQEGHLTYMVQDRDKQHTDEGITELVLEQLESLEHSSLNGTGFIVGWLATLMTRGIQRREGGEQQQTSREEAREDA